MSSKPRKVFIVFGVLSLVLVAGVLYINYFVPELRFGRINIISPYQSEARALSEKISGINSFQLTGEVKMGNIIAQNSSTIDLLNNKLKVDLTSFLQFKTTPQKAYNLSAELKRSSPSDFYLRFSKADVPQEISVLVKNFIGPWLRVDKNLMDQMLTEEPVYDFSEENFLEALRNTLKITPPFKLTRKISTDHYSFNVSPENLGEFLGKLFGDLSDQSFQDSFYDFNMSGEVWINPSDGLPQQIKLNWNDVVYADLHFTNFNQLTDIKAPLKSQSLEKLLQ